ncbi:PREDICTED: uncharacterized protein LOC108566777 isoform X2 [Nicrophorus vespilloides]|uniref:Uncharacterized protein LOC108566777 isoform X2 n=1 Tax=Nicrophorus vespilloides TaxID=110193 RepID=A0ABM1N654_NICVS|nr:PREDICTED: uncharacterized protein LOC108566777 isoform X2 [Nicrophorus vespilloides]
MEDRSRKISCFASSDVSAPPVLLRRRLSAPETIMRKHMLAQQRAASQDSQNSSESAQSCNWPMDPSSDPNLSKRRESDIRKSTLMKRFWDSSRIQFPRTYSEWQYSFGKMKLSSTPTTPEHSRGSRKNIFEAKTKSSPKRKISIYNGTYTSESRKSSVDESPKHMRKISPKPDSNNEDYAVYSSNFSNVTSSESQNTSRTVDNFDSAYANSCTSVSRSADTAKENNNNVSMPIKYQFVLSKDAEFVPKTTNEATQTTDTTNLNVISNVHLSQSTLNLIFNQVMQDVLKSKPEPSQPKIINVQTLPTFNVQTKPEDKPTRLISEVNVGSPYKVKESPLVPRLSALPRSTSMEVNISSNDSFDKDSDSCSLVDSLEDPSSPKIKNPEDKLHLLPDNSSSSNNILQKKSSVFYIPMKNEPEMILEENTSGDVSNLLPSKLKEKLMKRQIKREEKRKENKIRHFDVQNGNYSTYFDTSPELSAKPKPRKKKTTLPLIENKPLKPKSFWLPRNKKPEKLTPLTRESKKPESKQIEILEVMEIVEPTKVLSALPKTKSKIPVLVQQRLPKLSHRKAQKPAYLDYTDAPDPKFDQLIANILIDSLNREDLETSRQKKFDTIPEEKAEQNNNPIDKVADLLTQQVLENNNVEGNESTESPENAQMPKGWITFYMLQKNNSPESTSDEGTINMKTSKKCDKISQTPKDSDYKSEESDSESDRATKYQKGSTSKCGWSVTVSGTSNGEIGPDVEMRLKFPKLVQKIEKKTKNRDESFQSKFPPLSNKKKESGITFEEMCSKRQSALSNTKPYLNSKTHDGLLNQAKYEPRPTKTSTQRRLLHRPKNLKEITIPIDSNRNLEDIFRKFPNILAVNGNAMSREKKSSLSKLTESDLKHLLSHFNKNVQ